MESRTLYVSQDQLKLLDWDIILERITQSCFFEHNRQSFYDSPFIDQLKIGAELESLYHTINVFDELQESFNSYISGCPSASKHLTNIFNLKKGHVLSAKEINLAAHIIEIYERSKKSLTFEQLGLMATSDSKELKKSFLVPVRKFIDRYGEVHFDQHPLLSQITQEINETDKRLRERVRHLLTQEPYASVAQFGQYDILDDRYVLPLRSDSYQAHLGSIISRSQSGMTLFVEPHELRELTNRRIHLLAQREEILNQIFVKLSQQLTMLEEFYLPILSYSLKLDLLLSKAKICLEHGFTYPELTQDFSVEIKGFFHPLIDQPVPNDIYLSESKQGLVISGPNTGGKTVTLKSIALSQLFINIGLFVPALSAKLPVLESLYYFSHDQQDLTQGLSSFSSEAKQYIELASNIGDDSFIFIDEIFNSTSSEEASALAIGLLEHIHERKNVKVFLSTHHQLLKTNLHSNSSYVSCHVGFDFEKQVPTYKINYGSPGSSLALSIFDVLCEDAEQLKSISNRAKTILDHKHVSYEKLLEKLSSQKTRLDKEVQESNNLKKELKNQKQSSEGILFLQREKIREEYKDELDKLFKKAKTWLDDFKRNPPAGVNHRKIEKTLAKKKTDFSSVIDTSQKTEPLTSTIDNPPTIRIENIKRGESYHCSLTSSLVQVFNIDHRKRKLQVKHRNMTLWVPLATLSINKQKQIPATENVQIHIQKSSIGSIELDARGKRLEEFQQLVERSLDELLCGDIPYLNIVHGHGDGILKSWLRTHLKQNKDDFSWSSQDGNDGATLVKLSTQ